MKKPIRKLFYSFIFIYSLALTSAVEKPNIILIMADDMGYGELGCLGHPTFKTPVLDQMAQEGIMFTDFHSNGAVCSPTRAALMTGNYQSRCGIEGVVTAAKHRHTGLALSQTTMAEALKQAGYKTGIFGKWHLGYATKYNPVHQGFDQFGGFISGNIDLFNHIDQTGIKDWWSQDKVKEEKGYATTLITDKSIKFIRQNHQQPFFLYIPHAAPHYPYQGPEDKAYRKLGDGTPVRGIVENKKRAYKEMVEHMDAQIGRIMDELKKLNLDQNTLVIFCSDNGGVNNYGSSNGVLRGTKGSFFEGGHRVPCIMRWPGKITNSRVDSSPAMTMDLLPTFLTLAGFKSKQKFDGVDLSQLLLKEKPLKQRPLFWRKGSSYAVREGHWKLLHFKKITYLFNLANDLPEQNNLADQHPEKVQELFKTYKAWETDILTGVEMKTK